MEIEFLTILFKTYFLKRKVFQVPNFGLTRGSTHKTNTSFSIPVSIYFQYSHQLLVHITCVCLTHVLVSLLEISKLFLKEAKHCECVRFHLTSSGLSNLLEYSLKPRINTSTWECHRELLIASVWKSSFLLFCLRHNF